MIRGDKKKNRISMNIRNKKSPAFTLVEIIVILFIITVGLLGVLSLVIQNIQSQVINKNSIVAYQLAQEGVELVRKTRDTNWINSNLWNQGLADDDYFMDYLDESPQSLEITGSEKLYKNINNYYLHDAGGILSIFSRTINLTSLSDHSMKVLVNISWSNRNKNFNYSLETQLYDWY